MSTSDVTSCTVCVLVCCSQRVQRLAWRECVGDTTQKYILGIIYRTQLRIATHHQLYTHTDTIVITQLFLGCGGHIVLRV